MQSSGSELVTKYLEKQHDKKNCELIERCRILQQEMSALNQELHVYYEQIRTAVFARQQITIIQGQIYRLEEERKGLLGHIREE